MSWFAVDLGGAGLTLAAGPVEQLWDELLPLEVKELPADLAALDELLSDPSLLAPIAESWEAAARERGRPSLAIETYVRLMVIKAALGLGLRTRAPWPAASLRRRGMAHRRTATCPGRPAAEDDRFQR
jgi:hypothetical protein